MRGRFERGSWDVGMDSGMGSDMVRVGVTKYVIVRQSVKFGRSCEVWLPKISRQPIQYQLDVAYPALHLSKDCRIGAASLIFFPLSDF